MSRRDFLLEIGAEELPPLSLKSLADALAAGIAQQLQSASIKHGRVQRFATPRRLAVLIKGVAGQQPEQSIERRGPPVSVAFDPTGAPTRAAIAFAQICGTTLDALQRVTEAKGEFLYYRGRKAGAYTRDLLPGIVQTTIDSLPLSKRMRWGAGDVEFVRPVHWIVLLLGADVVPAKILGLESGRVTYGHRFHAPKPLHLSSPGIYPNVLRKRGYVVADFEERRDRIRLGIDEVARALGGEPVASAALLDEVAALVEWPVPIAGNFDRAFLELPREVLIATLQGHQRYFPLQDRTGSGRLLPHFIAVANLESRDPDQVRAGNERVVLPRLADARFFFETDRKLKLADRVAQLGSVVYHQKLGSRLDRVGRVRALAATIAGLVGVDAGLADRAALLAKVDLVTQMVGEFPELQGVMGRYYALADGEDPRVAEAIEHHYRPRFAGDELPGAGVATVLALADKLETLAGLFGVGQQPTGEKDPFALRRQALGVVRILTEAGLSLRLPELSEASFAVFPPGTLRDARADLEAFVYERLRSVLRESGYSANEVEAVLSLKPARLDQVPKQLAAVREFMKLPQAESLAVANKRIGNILKKTDGEPAVLDARYLVEPAEKSLAQAVEQIRPDVQRYFQAGDYARALTLLARVKEPVDAFFDTVMVMTEDVQLRLQRLALLRGLHGLMNQVADLSRLSG